jgi:hypothetical protein
MVQVNNTQRSAKFTIGEYAGILFRFLPVNKPLYAINLDLNYRYNRTKGKSSIQETKYIWQEVLFVSAIQFQATQNIKLSLGAEYQILDGIKRDSGSDTQINTFNTTQKQGLRYGLHYSLRRTEVIGFEWLAGYKNGGRLYFSRQF